MTWWQILIMYAAGPVIMGLMLIAYLVGFTDKVITRILGRYEDKVTRQSLAEARRLVDANREYPVRPDAGPPVKIRKARINRH